MEIAIPWKGFINNFRSKTPPTDGEIWKVNFSRVHWDTEIKDEICKTDSPEFNWVWSPQGTYTCTSHTSGEGSITETPSGFEEIQFLDDGLDKIRWPFGKYISGKELLL